MKIKQTLQFTAAALLFSTAQLSTWAQGTAFTYNGQLNDGTNPATGSYDLRFTIYDAATGGTAHGTLTNAATGITNGLFTVTLDFGAVFNGANYWLELAARTNGGGAFSALSPLQPILPAPYAIFSATAGSAATATTAGSANSVGAQNIVGTVPLAQLPAAVVTNNSTGLILNGTFSGNGGGLTNLSATNLTGMIADRLLSSNIARLNIPNTTTQATAALVITAGFVIDTTNLNGGAGYTVAPLVAVADVSGSNAVITATISNGAVVSLTVQNAGIHYSAGATLTIAPPPSNAYQTFTSGNVFTGVSIFTSGDNTFAGSFTGNGAGLTNLDLTGPSALSDLGNAADGYQALAADTTGTNNTAQGYQALSHNTSGYLNTADGYQALFTNTTGNRNVALGDHALFSNTTGGGNTAVGSSAMFHNTTGGNNMAYGIEALFASTTGWNNSAFGGAALRANTTGTANTAVGWQALWSNTTGGNNTAIGFNSLLYNQTGGGNTADGLNTLVMNTSGGSNTAVGQGALAGNTTASQNTAVGYKSLNVSTTGSNNIALGYQAGYNITTGSSNIDIGNLGLATDTNIIRIGSDQTQAFIAGVITGDGSGLTNVNLTGPSALSALGNAANGYQALGSNTTGSNNTANGQQALYSNTTGKANVANGYQALFSNTSGFYNTANGQQALFFNTSGSQNTATGYRALQFNTTGSYNDASGFQALYNNTTGSYNTANGQGALQNNTTGAKNTANGYQALFSNTNGVSNVANGFQALYSNSVASDNTAIGYWVLSSTTTGSNNTAIGFNAMGNNTTGNHNVAAGWNALWRSSTGSNNIALGSLAGSSITTGSDNIDIGNPGLGTDTNIIRIGSGQTQAFIAGVITGDGGGLTNLTVGQLSSAVLTNNASGVTLGGNFSGNGAGLTSLNPTNLSAGTAAINISGNAATATTAANVTGNIADSLLSPNVALLNATNAFTGTNTFAGTVIATNASNVISGTFTGDGSGLTGIILVTPPPGMALIPAGSFTMGNSIGDPDITDATPISVYVAAFYMDVNLVSWSQWQSVYFWATNHGYGFVNPGAGKAANHPVQSVDWYDAVKWCNARSQQAGRPPVYYTDALQTQVYTNGEVSTLYPNWAAGGYRLPTEAEWEKAARGGLSGQRFPWANVITENLANYNGATASYAYDLGPNGYNAAFTNGVAPYTSPVGYFAANGYGLYDMAGNVAEWCWDWYGSPYAGGSDPHGPAGPLTYRVLRGGHWGAYASYARCAERLIGGYPSYLSNAVGFRCVRGL